MRRRRRTPLRGEAESVESAGAVVEARGRSRAIRTDLHGECDGALATAAGLLRRRAVARDVGIRWRRDHEPGVALRRPDPVARRPGVVGHGEDGYPGPED